MANEAASGRDQSRPEAADRFSQVRIAETRADHQGPEVEGATLAKRIDAMVQQHPEVRERVLADSAAAAQRPRAARSAAPPPRLVVLSQVYFQGAGARTPQEVETRFVRLMASDDEPLIRRRFEAGPSWQPLDFGWLKAPGMLVLQNLEGHFTQVIPEPEERAAADARVIEVGHPMVGALFLVPPGENLPGVPACAERVFVRCLAGPAKYALSLFPS